MHYRYYCALDTKHTMNAPKAGNQTRWDRAAKNEPPAECRGYWVHSGGLQDGRRREHFGGCGKGGGIIEGHGRRARFGFSQIPLRFSSMAKGNTVVDVLVLGGHPSAYLAAALLKN